MSGRTQENMYSHHEKSFGERDKQGCWVANVINAFPLGKYIVVPTE